MSRSPIERLIDAACKPEQETQTLQQAAVTALLTVADAAKAWWVERRPMTWDEDKHLTLPEFTDHLPSGPCNDALARAVAEWVKLGG